MPGEGRDKRPGAGERIGLLPIPAVSILVLIFDRVSKALAGSRMSPGSSIPVLKDVFHVTLVRNTGAAFGLFRDLPALFLAIGAGAAAVMIILLPRMVNKGLLAKLSFALVLGGVLGNLIDRITLGYVVDMIDFRIWPVFNVADAAITVGVGLICMRLLTKRE